MRPSLAPYNMKRFTGEALHDGILVAHVLSSPTHSSPVGRYHYGAELSTLKWLAHKNRSDEVISIYNQTGD